MDEIQRWISEIFSPTLLVVADERCTQEIKSLVGLDSVSQLLQPYCHSNCFVDFRCRLEAATGTYRQQTQQHRTRPLLSLKLIESPAIPGSPESPNLDQIIAYLHSEYSVKWTTRTEHCECKTASAIPTTNDAETIVESSLTETTRMTNTILSSKHCCNDYCSFNSHVYAPLLGTEYSADPFNPFLELIVDRWFESCSPHHLPMKTSPVGILFVVPPSDDVYDVARGLRESCGISTEKILARLVLVLDIGSDSDEICSKSVVALQQQYPPESCRGLSLGLRQISTVQSLSETVSSRIDFAAKAWILDSCEKAMDIQARNLEFQVKHFRRGFRNQVRSYLGIGAWHSGSGVKMPSKDDEEGESSAAAKSTIVKSNEVATTTGWNLSSNDRVAPSSALQVRGELNLE